MKLLVIRHSIAEDRAEFAESGSADDLRPLTRRGRKKMKRAARGLAELVDHLDVLATSPLVRAQETAAIVAKRFGDVAVTQSDALQPEQPFEALLEWLRHLDDAEMVAVVGHEPHLSGLASWLLSGQERTLFELKKGGACLLEFDHLIEAGGAQLRWLLTPAALRALGG